MIDILAPLLAANVKFRNNLRPQIKSTDFNVYNLINNYDSMTKWKSCSPHKKSSKMILICHQEEYKSLMDKTYNMLVFIKKFNLYITLLKCKIIRLWKEESHLKCNSIAYYTKVYHFISFFKKYVISWHRNTTPHHSIRIPYHTISQ